MKQTNLSNFRCICCIVSTSQTHFEIIPLHECNSSYWPAFKEIFTNYPQIFIRKIKKTYLKPAAALCRLSSLPSSSLSSWLPSARIPYTIKQKFNSINDFFLKQEEFDAKGYHAFSIKPSSQSDLESFTLLQHSLCINKPG